MEISLNSAWHGPVREILHVMSACEVLLDDTVCVIQDGRKVVCGSQDGVLLLYSWGHMLDCRCELLPVY